MKNNYTHIEFFIAAINPIEKEVLTNWCNNINTLLQYFIKFFTSENVHFEIINLTDLKALKGDLLKDRVLRIVVITHEMELFEQDLIDLKFDIIPIVKQQKKLRSFLEVFASFIAEDLSLYETRLSTEDFKLSIKDTAANEGLMNFAFRLTAKQFGFVKKGKPIRKSKILMCSTHQTLLNYKYQVSSYLERLGFEVSTFYYSKDDKEGRAKSLITQIELHDISIHLLNENHKRFEKDKYSILELEIETVIDYINILDSKPFNAFIWMDHEIYELESKQEQLMRQVKAENSQTSNINVYQLPIEEFKEVIKIEIDKIEKNPHIKNSSLSEVSFPIGTSKKLVLVYNVLDNDDAHKIADELRALGHSFDLFEELIFKESNTIRDWKFLNQYSGIIFYAKQANHNWIQSTLVQLLRINGLEKSMHKTRIYTWLHADTNFDQSQIPDEIEVNFIDDIPKMETLAKALNIEYIE